MQPIAKIVFLDFDGVLVNRESLMQASGAWADADPECVKALNHITDTTGAAIVVSSSWRCGMADSVLRDVLKKWGVTGQFIGSTPIDYTAERGNEIQQWMDGYVGHINSFVILDDDSDMAHLKPYLVKTSMEHGLQMGHARLACRVLGMTVPEIDKFADDTYKAGVLRGLSIANELCRDTADKEAVWSRFKEVAESGKGQA